MTLVIFDIDGTLVQTNRVDSECYQRAMADEFGITDIDSNWLNYRYSTDSGIVQEIFERKFDRLPAKDELRRLQHAFVELLRRAHKRDPACFRQVPGAAELLAQLAQQEATSVAISTGGWRLSAMMKLSTASISADNIPASFADDALEREELIRLAIHRARETGDRPNFSRCVYVGDRAWDVVAARRLEMPFIGVGVDGTADELRAAGATIVLTDFRDAGGFVELLAHARPPL